MSAAVGLKAMKRNRKKSGEATRVMSEVGCHVLL